MQYRPPPPPGASTAPPPHYQTQAADLSLGSGPDHHHHHPDLYGLGVSLRPAVLYSGGGGGTSPPLAAHQLYEESLYTASADTSMDQVMYLKGT